MGAGRAAEAGVVGVRGAALRAVTKASAKAAYFLADHERGYGAFQRDCSCIWLSYASF